MYSCVIPVPSTIVSLGDFGLATIIISAVASSGEGANASGSNTLCVANERETVVVVCVLVSILGPT